jgi:NADH-quinone oxidoreductase subunit G
MIDIEIDGKTIQAEQGAMIIEVADLHGINIPRFCYHSKLSIAANCRMCLVEVEKAPKPLPACATPVTPGMKVFTHSPKALESQRSVMEFLLINHPLDCPICDQGGECELQDVSMGYGSDVSRFTEGKRSVADEDLGPLIATDMTRCIQCTRCVRFGQEISGVKELGAIGRGENMQIATYVKHSLTSEISGNIIDLCPVGALTSKPFRFKARAWELRQSSSIAPHDCVGSNVYVHTRRQEVMRVVPRENEAVNETWISDRDRFSYLGIASQERLKTPLLRRNGEWHEVDWTTALNAVVEGFTKILNQFGPQQIAALTSPSATIEELYLLQKLWRELGSHNIDHRLHESDFSDQAALEAFPHLDCRIQELERQDTVVLIGSNVQKEQPLLGHRIRKAALQGAQVIVINAIEYEFNFPLTRKLIATPQKLVDHIAGIAKAILQSVEKNKWPEGAEELLAAVKPSPDEQAIAKRLLEANKKIILLGSLAINHPNASVIRSLCRLIANISDTALGFLTEGANSAGAWIAGAVPHRGAAGLVLPHSQQPGYAASQALVAKLKGYLFLGIEPELDCADSSVALKAMAGADWVVALSAYQSPTLLQKADVILPIALPFENMGTYVNVEGVWQSFKEAVPAPGESRPAWKVLRVLANLFDVSGFQYNSVDEIKSEIHALAAEKGLYVCANDRATNTSPQINNSDKWFCPAALPASKSGMIRLTEWPLYAVDSMVRRATALQRSASTEAVGIRINSRMAEQLSLTAENQAIVQQGSVQAVLPVIIDSRIPDDCAFIAAGYRETSLLGAAFGIIEVRHA